MESIAVLVYVLGLMFSSGLVAQWFLYRSQEAKAASLLARLVAAEAEVRESREQFQAAILDGQEVKQRISNMEVRSSFGAKR